MAGPATDVARDVPSQCFWCPEADCVGQQPDSCECAIITASGLQPVHSTLAGCCGTCWWQQLYQLLERQDGCMAHLLGGGRE